jgi:hypothetical protein
LLIQICGQVTHDRIRRRLVERGKSDYIRGSYALLEKLGTIATGDEQIGRLRRNTFLDVARTLRLWQLGQRAAQILDHLLFNNQG